MLVGGDAVAGVVNRFVVFHDCHGYGECVFPLSLHGNSEYCGYIGGFGQGMILAGNKVYGKGVKIIQRADSDAPETITGPVRGTELKGTDVEISGCDIVWRVSPTATLKRVFDFSQGGIINSDTTLGGTIRINDNNVTLYTDVDSTDVNSGLIFSRIANSGSLSSDIDFEVKDNNVKIIGSGSIIPLYTASFSGSNLRRGWMYGNTWPGSLNRATITDLSSFNEGVGTVSHGFVVPSPYILFSNNSALSSNSSDIVYQRTGKTEILSGIVYATDIALTVIVDGRTLIDTRSGGSVGRNRGQDAAGNNYSMVTLPHIMAYESLEIVVYEEAGLAQVYGASGYIKEY